MNNPLARRRFRNPGRQKINVRFGHLMIYDRSRDNFWQSVKWFTVSRCRVEFRKTPKFPVLKRSLFSVAHVDLKDQKSIVSVKARAALRAVIRLVVATSSVTSNGGESADATPATSISPTQFTDALKIVRLSASQRCVSGNPFLRGPTHLGQCRPLWRRVISVSSAYVSIFRFE